MKKKSLILIFIIIIFLSSCSNSSAKYTQKYEDQFFAMGTVITQQLYYDDSQKVFEEVKKRFKDIENSMTINTPGSLVDNLNSKSGSGSFVKLNKDIIYVLSKAKNFASLSKGSFDVSVGPLVKAWGVFTDNPRIPNKNEIDKLKSLVDYNDIKLNEKSLSASLKRKNQIVDLGGIAKGYAGDEAIKIFKKHGITSAFVNLGGNVVTLGGKPDGSPWKVGIQNPRGPDGEYIAIVKVSGKTVVTSGDYERFFEKDGVRYHHIIDPTTGYPSKSGLISTTIVTSLSIDADALSTSTFVLGLEKGMALVKKMKDTEAIFITEDKKIYTTTGLKDKITITDDNNEYEYIK